MDKYTDMKKVMFMEYPELVSVADLQKMLGIKQTKAYELVQKKIIKSVKVGRGYKIPKINIILYIMGEKQL